MAGSKKKIEKPRQKQAVEQEIISMVNKLSPKLQDPNERKALNALIGERKDSIWEEGTVVYFPKSLTKEFNQLRELFGELGIESKVGTERGKLGWFLREEYMEEVKDIPATTPFGAPTERPPVKFHKTAKKQTQEETNAAEKGRLAEQLKSAAGPNGAAIVKKAMRLKKWRELRESAKKRLATLNKMTPGSEAARKKKIARMNAEKKTIKELTKKIELTEKEFRQFLADYNRINELSTGLYDGVVNNLKPYNLKGSAAHAQRMLTEKEKKEPIYREPGKVAAAPDRRELDRLLGIEPIEPAPAAKKKPAPVKKTKKEIRLKAEFKEWRYAEFKNLYNLPYQDVNDEYNSYKADYEQAYNKVELGEISELAGATLEAQALNGLRDNMTLMYRRLSSPRFSAAFRKWARGKYGAKTEDFKAQVTAYRSLLKGIRTLRDKQYKLLVKTRKEAATLAKEIAEAPLTFDSVLRWASTNTVSLDYINRNRKAVEAMLPFVRANELGNVLQQIDEASVALMKNAPPPSAPVRIPVGGARSEKDYEAVRRGMSILYAARGLKHPDFTSPIAAKRAAWKGRKVMRVTSAPELFSPPSKKNVLPAADKNGNVFIKYKGGRTIWLTKEQKEGIEASLTTTNIGLQIIKKYRAKAPKDAPVMVDAAGAILLADYLREKGWTNVSAVAWKGEKSARARLRIENVPETYWERPTPQSLRKAARLRRENGGGDIFAAIGEIEIPDEVVDKPIDITKGHYAEKFRELSDIRKKYLKQFYVLTPNDLYRQRQQLETIAKNPAAKGTPRMVFFNSFDKATQAAELLQNILHARGMTDLTVYVERKVPFVGLEKHFGGHMMVVRETPANAFAERGEIPIRTPNFIEKEANAVLKTAAERARLEGALNSPAGETQTFYLSKFQAENLEQHLVSIGFPWETAADYARIKFSEVPEEQRGVLWSTGQKDLYKVTLTVPPMLQEVLRKDRGVQLQNVKNKLSDLPLGRRRYDALVRQARYENLPREDKVFTFRKKEGGAKTAQAIYDALKASGLVDVSYDGKNTVIITQAPEKPKAKKKVMPLTPLQLALRGGRPQILKARKVYLERNRSGVVESQNMDPSQVKLASDLVKAFDPEAKGARSIKFTFGVADEPGTVKEVFATKKNQTPEERTYGLFCTGAAYLQQSYWRHNKEAYFNKAIANGLLAGNKLAKDEPGFSEDSIKRTMKEYAFMHSGPGVKKSKELRERYAAKASTMYYMLEQFSAEELLMQIKDPAAALGLMHGANFLRDTICARNADYHKWEPAKQERYRKAAFDVGLRTLIFIAACEGGGPVPLTFRVPSMEKEPAKFAKYRKAYTNMLFSWLGGSPQFTFKEADVTYRTYERIVVTPDGRRYLTVPVPKDPKHVEIIAEFVPKVSPEGVHYYEIKRDEKGKIKKIDKNKRKIRKILPRDSVGPFGPTPEFRIGAYPVRFKYEIIKKTPEPIPIPVPVWSKAYAAKHHIMRDWVLRWKEAIVRIRPTKEILFSQVVKNPYLRTMAVEIDTDVKTKQRTAFFHPPRHRFNEKTGKEEALPDYSDEGDYYSVGYAEAGNNGKGTVYAYKRLDAEDRKEHPYPGDAREFYGMSDEKLKKEGVKRVAIGRYDFGTGEVAFKSDKLKATLEKHFVGNWPLTKENMGEPLSKKEVEEAGITYHEGANYYRITDADLGSYGDTQALGPETRIRGPFNRERTDRTAILEPSTNIPKMYTPKRKR